MNNRNMGTLWRRLVCLAIAMLVVSRCSAMESEKSSAGQGAETYVQETAAI